MNFSYLLRTCIHVLGRITQTQIIAFLLLVVGFLGYRIFYHDPSVIPIYIHTSTEKSSQYDITLEYPEFATLPRVFNTHIKKTVDDALVTFRSDAAQSESNRHASSGKGQPAYQYSFAQSFTPEQLSSHIVSFVIETSYFTGGAHGGEDIYTFTFDRDKNKEVTLDDIFGTVPGYLHRISDYVQSDLKEKLRLAGGGHDPDMTMLMQGVAPTLDNFKRFTLDSGSTITFYFPQYQVASYVYGKQKVTMPLSFILSSATLANR